MVYATILIGLSCTPPVLVSVAKQEINHTEGVVWIHHLLFDWKQETRRERDPIRTTSF